MPPTEGRSRWLWRLRSAWRRRRRRRGVRGLMQATAHPYVISLSISFVGTASPTCRTPRDRHLVKPSLLTTHT